MATMAEPHVDRDTSAGQYLTFVLANECYGLEILKVREIIQMPRITPVPRTPDYIQGVINLRGKVIPVMDLRLKFGLSKADHTDQTCIIVVNVGDVEVGVIVDAVSEVLEIAGEDIDDAPAFGTNANTEFILGMGKAQDKVTILLDICKVLDGEQLASLAAEPGDEEGN